jgi:hypothetical protein
MSIDFEVVSDSGSPKGKGEGALTLNPAAPSDSGSSKAEGSSKQEGFFKLAVTGELRCMKCQGEVEKRSDFLLVSEKEDWCNALWGWCQACSGLEGPEFKKQQSKKWKRRQTELTGILRQRGMEFNQLCQVLLEKFPGIEKKKLYEAARFRVHALGTAAALAAFGVEAVTKQRYDDACKRYFDTVRALITEVEPSEGKDVFHHQVSAFLSSEADFLTMVTTSISVSYACKGKDCRYYGLNDQWFQKAGGYQFRCPNCAKFYRPWKVNPNTDNNYAKVVCVVNPKSGEKVIFPAKWPASQGDNWLQEMMTATAHDGAARKGTTSDTLLALDEMLKAIGIPADGRFVHFPVKESTLQALKNTSDFSAEAVWSERNEKGFYGNVLPPQTAAQAAFDEWPTFIALFAQLLHNGEDAAVNLTLSG